MTCSKDDTDEGREQGKVSTEKRKAPGAGLYFLPLVTALPIAAVMALALHRIWPFVHKMVSILMKLVVRA